MTSNTRTLTVTLAIDVRAMTADELSDCGMDDFCDDEDGQEITLDDFAASEIAGVIPGTLTFDEVQDEMFAGSGIFARLTGARVVSAAWASAEPAVVSRESATPRQVASDKSRDEINPMTQDRKHDIEGVVEQVADCILGGSTFDRADRLEMAAKILALPALSERQARIEGLEKALEQYREAAIAAFDALCPTCRGDAQLPDWAEESRSALSSGEGGGDSSSGAAEHSIASLSRPEAPHSAGGEG